MKEGDGDLTPAAQDFAARVGERLRQCAEQLDGATASRLNRARQRALAECRPRRRRGAFAAALATSAAAGLAVALWLGSTPGPVAPPLVQTAGSEEVADMDVLMADDSLEMIEDLDFYAWMDPDLDAAQLQAELESTG